MVSLQGQSQCPTCIEVSRFIQRARSLSIYIGNNEFDMFTLPFTSGRTSPLVPTLNESICS